MAIVVNRARERETESCNIGAAIVVNKARERERELQHDKLLNYLLIPTAVGVAVVVNREREEELYLNNIY